MDAKLQESLACCYPFHQIAPLDLAPLFSELECRSFERGQTLLRRSTSQSEKFTYLIAGSAELRRSFFDRTELKSGQGSALQPLDYLLRSEGGQVVALETCQTVQIARDLLDRAMAAGSPLDYGVATLQEAELAEEFLISDGEVEVDWMSRFLQSPLAQHLPALNIQQLLACLTVRDIAKGETIVRRGEIGDAMYVVTRGMALVRTDVQSAFHGREFSLIPGDYFGEEALVADTVRNATVVMEAAGSVACLDREAFNELVRSQLVRMADDKLMERCLMAATDEGITVLDVRFPIEYRRDALPASRNIPISLLRARMGLLNLQSRILVTSQGGRRSELAVFLLRQAGFDAYLMQPPGNRFTQVDVSLSG